MIYLCEIIGRHRQSLAQKTFYYGSAGYNHPSAPGFFDGRIKQPALFRRDIFDAGKIGGGSRTGWGELTLVNADGVLDDLADWAFDDSQFRLLGLADASRPFSESLTILTGTIEQVLVGLDLVRVRIRDRRDLIDVAVQTALFGGTNVLPDGVDGLADDIKGTVKPDCWGAVFNAEPPLVNTSRYIYQLDCEKIADVTAVYDSGLALVRGTQHDTIAALQTTLPAAGAFDLALTDQGSFIRLSTAPAGRVTVDLQGKVRDGQPLVGVADTIRDILMQRAGLSADDLSDDLAALASDWPAPIGLFVSDTTQVPDLLDALAASAGAWWGFDRVGKVRIVRVNPPVGPVSLTFRQCGPGMVSGAGDIDLTKLDIQPTQDTGRGIPFWRVKVGYARAWAVQDASELVSGSTRSAGWSSSEYRWAVAENPAIQTLHPAASEIEVVTLLASETDAQALAASLLSLHGQQRTIKKAEAWASSPTALGVDLGDVVGLKLNRLGLDGGASQVVTGLRYDLQSGRMEVDLWG